MRVLESQVALAFSLCAVAAMELDSGHHEEARTLVRKVRDVWQSLCGNLEQYVPADRLDEVVDELEQLEARIVTLERRIAVRFLEPKYFHAGQFRSEWQKKMTLGQRVGSGKLPKFNSERTSVTMGSASTMAEHDDYRNERLRELLSTAYEQQQSTKSRLSAASFFCALATAELDRGRVESAKKLIHEVHDVVCLSCSGSDGSQNGLSDAINDLRAQLACLEPRLREAQPHLATDSQRRATPNPREQEREAA